MVIWYAIAIYIVGIAVILYTRPSFMFRDDGIWKEFGLSSRDQFTVFPFWMFALVWSILSYALANLASLFVASVVAKSVSLASAQAPTSTPVSNFIPVSSQQSPLPSFPASALNEAAAATAVGRIPGYYVLEGAMNGPRYVYWGPEPPRF